ncbi:hypothetical protein, partial [Oribacterium sinus]|uniref:hypothetical protein n=1 Tax=Oribacterium sinus TaxID=237576 RepID=UPI0028D641FE
PYVQCCERTAVSRRLLLDRKQLPSEVGLHQDDFSDEKSVLTVLSEKLQYLCFSQVPAGSDCSLSCLYCICRFSFSISTVLRFAGYLQALTGVDYPKLRPILPKISLYFDFSQLLFAV